MSHENVARLRAAVEAFNERDGSKFDRLLAPDAEIVPVRAAIEGTTYRGTDAASQYVAAVDESWESLTRFRTCSSREEALEAAGLSE
jgi:hypothetical protein